MTANTDRVNALNVFPVPDGDTGTNMGLTMRAALSEAANSPPEVQTSAGEIAAKVAYGSLMGARGNSGVILSQIFRGFARAVADRQEIDGRDLAAALSGAREMAYKAVMRPVEGTMLTVIRVAAERAEASAARTPALAAVLAEAGRGARQALATTPDLLDILRQAGVVDAGGQGIVFILEGMERFARGEQIVTAQEAPTAPLGAEMAFLDQVEELHGDEAFGYCTNFMVFGEGMDFERCRAEIAAMGESAVIVGDDRVLKVHIHALNPGKVLDYAVGLGQLGQIKIDNMQAQTDALVDQRDQEGASTPNSTSRPTNGEEPDVAGFGLVAKPAPVGVEPAPLPAPPIGHQAVLAVAAGEGLAEALRSMGATSIAHGGQTMNPSTEELLSAVETAPADEVILLPNNPNIVLTANQVPDLSTKKVRVVPSRSVPQGLAALASYNVDGDLDKNVTDMTRALQNVRTVELTCAVRDAIINGVDVGVGQVIGLLDDRLVASGDNPTTVACEALQKVGLDDAELVTIFTGAGAKAEGTDGLRQTIEANYPNIAVEVYEGGQPHYHYVIAIE
ncbi:MAG: DAK2 domain-containing protein [Chloroflexota bacterium]|nr:DAK2 domain-containing protein [Chloroflexota bacterium]